MELLSFQEYRKIKQKSAGVTVALGLFLLLVSLVWTFVETTDPPLFEVLSEGSGGVDFGNWVEGSGNGNNFEEPSPNPGEGKAQVIQETKVSSTNDNVPLSGDAEESDVTAPPVKENKEKEKKNQNPQEKNKEKEVIKNTSQNSHFSTSNSNQSGGSNHGNSDLVGNRGRDDVKILDSDGLYAFGSGEEGLQGRKPISLPKPIYEVEAEAKITYEFTIAPNGTVKHVKALTLSSNAELKNAGIKAIYKWKFEPIEQDKIQKTKVTITFKLK